MKKIILIISTTILGVNLGFSQSQKGVARAALSASPLLGNYTENNNSNIDGFALKTSVGYNFTDKIL